MRHRAKRFAAIAEIKSADQERVAAWFTVMAAGQIKSYSPMESGYWLMNVAGAVGQSKQAIKSDKALYAPVTVATNADGITEMLAADLYQIINTGFFQVMPPECLMLDIQCILQFLTSYSDDERYTMGFNQAHPDVTAVPVQGYMIDNSKPLPGENPVSQGNQARRLNLKKGPHHNFWKYLPENVRASLENYRNFKNKILRDILVLIGINPELHEKLTCGVSADAGDEYALFNDFQVDGIDAKYGLKQHKDYGILTALLSPVYREAHEVGNDSGLEAYINTDGHEQWHNVVPVPGSIIFNFGLTLEKALQDCMIVVPGFPPTKLQAALHQVHLSEKRRYSFANFGDPPFDAIIHTLWANQDRQGVKPLEKYSEHCIKENLRLYDL